jgi:hypothetical protein
MRGRFRRDAAFVRKQRFGGRERGVHHACCFQKAKQCGPCHAKRPRRYGFSRNYAGKPCALILAEALMCAMIDD